MDLDPIIKFYTNLKHGITADEGGLPQFSLLSLRLSIQRVMGRHLSMPSSDQIELFKKLLVLYYATQNFEVNDLVCMMSCFTRAQIEYILENDDKVVAEWVNFITDHMAEIIYQETLRAMLQERFQRAAIAPSDITKAMVDTEVKRLCEFFNHKIRMHLYFVNSMHIRLSGNPQNKSGASAADKGYLTIYKDLESTLHPWITCYYRLNPPRILMQHYKAKGVDTLSPLSLQIIDALKDNERALTVLKGLPSPSCGRRRTKRIKISTYTLDFDKDIPSEILSPSPPSAVEESNPEVSGKTSITPERQSIDEATAKEYISALQFYALSVSCFDAIPLLYEAKTMMFQ